MLVSISPFKTILDLKKEVSRVYRLHYPKKTEECKHIQDGSGYLACDDYHVGLIFKNNEAVFALNAVQPMEKYSDQWRNNEPSSSIHRIGEQQSITERQSCAKVANDSAAKVAPVNTPASTLERKQLDEHISDEASETDCSDELIPQVLQGNKLTRMTKPAPVPVDTQVNSPSLTTKNLRNKKEVNKKEPASVFTDSSLTDSDSDTSIINKAIKGGGKVIGDEPKSTPKKSVVKKAIPAQSVVTSTGSDDKTKDSMEIRKGQLATDVAGNSTPQSTVTKKYKTKRKRPSDDGQGISSEKKGRKKISKMEIELANTSSQSMILDNAKLWIEQ